MSRFVTRIAAVLATALGALGFAATGAAAPPGTPIANRGYVEFVGPNGQTTIASNEVSLLVAPTPSRAALTLLRTDPARGSDTIARATQCVNPQGTTPAPPPLASNGQPLSLAQALRLGSAASVHGGEAVFLSLVDADRNRDAALRDTIDLVVTAAGGDSATVRLEETDVDSGRFVGYVQTRAAGAIANDCVLQVERDGDITARYVDPNDTADAATASALVDPFSLVFDSRTGAPVDGARVRLVDAATGTAAVVLGDDGVSAYPAEIVTGQNVTDAGGTVYAFPPGVFRFPLVASGDYRLVVEPPARYAFPSAVPDADLQALPGAPYRISAASTGGALTVAGQVAPAVDVPLDGTGDTLFLEKTTTTRVAAVGDFIPYSVALRNAGQFAALRNVVVTDTLPRGLRYQTGSARLDSQPIADPEIGADGRTLTFRVASLAPSAQLTLRYVAVVATGTVGTQLVNSATATADGGVASNDATAVVQLREELFSSKAIVMGRVVAGTCETHVEQGESVAGVRVYLEDGRYAVTDDEGKYHFEGVEPGSHVVQIDTITLPLEVQPLACGTRVRSAGSAISQFVELRGGALATADFVVAHRAAPSGDVALELTTAATPDRFVHSAAIATRTVALSQAELLVLLPDGLVYVPGSATLAGAPLADPELANGSARFALGTLAADATPTLEFATRGADSIVGDAEIRAVLRFTTPVGRTQSTAPVANLLHREASQVEHISYTFSPRFNAYAFAPQFGSLQTEIDPRDRVELERIAGEWRGMRQLSIKVVGHADRTPISPRNRGKFPDNYALSAARAAAVANYLRTALPDATIEIEGRGADEPVADGTAPESLARNRRVEIHVSGVRTLAAAEWRIVTPTGSAPAVATQGTLGKADAAVPAPVMRAARSAVTTALEPPIDIATLSPGIAFVQPSADYAPGVPALRVAVAHLPGQTVRLAVNGRAANELTFEGSETNAAKTVALARWRGVNLTDGENELVATVYDAAGTEVAKLERTVHYGGGAVRAELVEESSLLSADGRSQPVIALRVFDASGQPARPGTLGAYSVDPPYRTWWEVETLRDNPLLVTNRREPTFAVEDDGLVRIVLEPTAQTGTVVLRLRFNERQQQEIRAWLAPEQRDWILVGIAEGTAAYNRISDALVPPDVDDGYTSDGRLAFFAKGQIKGSTLLTAAFDSDRQRKLAEEQLFGVIEPDRYYTLYGDAVEQRFEAATAEKLFLKIERRQFAALFGDFETGFTITELGRYGRALTGVKSDYAGKHVAVSAFAAENREAYGRDELRGDGTSGPYRLSQSDLVVGSDRLRIEVRDRIRSEVIVEQRVLTRFIDYSLDYLTGVVTFKQPIPSRDSSFNPVYVIAEYETLDVDANSTTAGARATTRLADDKLELGATVINEASNAGDTRLAATDLRFRPTGALEVRAEVAQSSSPIASRGDASAYLAEVEHVTERVDVQAYVREQEQGFGVGQQLTTEDGTRKVGVDARTKLSERWTARGEAFTQRNLETGADRQSLTAEARRESDDATASFGLRRVEDDLPLSGLQRSDLVSLGGSRDVLNDRVTLRALTEQALNGRDDSFDFPERTTLGLDYHVTAATTLFTEVEDATGENIDTTMTRVGVRSTPWNGTQLSSSVNREFGEYGPRVFANVGLTQSWQISDGWAMDVGVDQSKTVQGTNVERFDTSLPFVSGSVDEDYLATFLGGQYRADVWTFTSRLERRDADRADRWAFVGGFFREPVEGRALSLTTRWLDNQTLTGRGRTVDGRFSYAYRPIDSRFIVLQRLDLERDDRNDPLTRYETARFVDNMNVHWQASQKLEVGGQIGARYVKSTIDGMEYSGWSSLLGFDLRRELTPLLDIGLHGTWLDSEAGGTSERAVGIDLGINAAKNMWISVGYNFEGFRDDHFDASRYTVAGPYVRFRFKADQDTFKDLDLARLRPGTR